MINLIKFILFSDSGNIEIVKLLLDNGAEITTDGTYSFLTPHIHIFFKKIFKFIFFYF